ncbi:MAG: OmpA family protein [Candidatus Omnitrophota bacterium]
MKKIMLVIAILLVFVNMGYAEPKQEKEIRREGELKELQKRFEWWPTDAKPGPVKDPERGGYWWWPNEPGKMRPWGNRGYVYVYRIIFDYQEEELPAPEPQELRPSLLIKKIIKNVKVYFNYDKSVLRDDVIKILKNSIGTLKRNPETSILITGNCDRRGSEAYNEKLGKRRGEAVKRYMLENGIDESRIKIISRGKLDAVAHVTDLEGMQKDRNAQFMIAEVEEVMLPYPGIPQETEAKPLEEGRYIIEKEEEVEAEVKVSTREYTVKKGDSLSKIAKEQLGGAHRWKYLYELNKDKIKGPDKLRVGKKLIIPIE